MSLLIIPTSCHYCGGLIRFVTKKQVLIWDFEPSNELYVCVTCSARIGVHQGTKNPLGMLADAKTRDARRRAHLAFDGLWIDGHIGRFKGYAWLAMKLGIEHAVCHIGWFDTEVCERVIEICRTPPTTAEIEGVRSKRPWKFSYRLEKPIGLSDLCHTAVHGKSPSKANFNQEIQNELSSF